MSNHLEGVPQLTKRQTQLMGEYEQGRRETPEWLQREIEKRIKAACAEILQRAPRAREFCI